MKNVPDPTEINYLAESNFDNEMTIQKSMRNNDITVFDQLLQKK
jgi:hypothetical protein